MTNKIPVLLINEETKRRNAKKVIKDAIQNIKAFGTVAGVSDRSLFEFLSLSKYIEKELIKEKFK